MSRQLRIAILGGGRMAVQHATAIRTRPEAQLIAVVDPYLNAGQIAERFGAGVDHYATPEEMLERSTPDIVHVVTPPSTHYALARRCIEHGVHVYVEKPFALSAREAEEILELARERGVQACPAHQVLFQRAGQEYQRHLDMIGPVIHVESYFSFRPVRRRPDGGAPLTAVDQLIDILPHPVYLMLSALEHNSDSSPELVVFEVAAEGEVRAVVRNGSALATLIVSLRARPVESYLRIAGANGSVAAEFVLGAIVKSFGPGASGPALVVKPFSQAWQLFWGSMAGLFRRIFRKQKSYPGLSELLERFYASTRGDGPAPVPRETILNTVKICEQISNRLIAADQEAEARASDILEQKAHELPSILPSRGTILVTGGSGFLGKPVLRALRQSGWQVRVPVRRLPSMRQRVPGVDYVQADLSSGLAPELFTGASIVAHLAAETAGDQAAHQRNTIDATRKLLESMQAANVRRLINISSVAVLRPGSGRMHEDSPIDRGNVSRGSYVWAKAEAECLANEYATNHEIDVKTIRLGPLVDFEDFDPPGRLGREVARLFVAMGNKSNALSVCDVQTAASVIRYYADHFEQGPACVNLIEAPAPTRLELVQRLRAARPDLRFIWMPFPILWILSRTAVLAQKVLRPGRKALDVYSAFKAEAYDTSTSKQVIEAAQNAQSAIRSTRASEPAITSLSAINEN